MKKLIIVCTICALSSYIYAAPSLSTNAYTQLQSEGTFLAPQTAFEPYVPFQNSNTSRKEALISKAESTRRAGMITTSTGFSIMTAGATFFGMIEEYDNVEYSDVLIISGLTTIGIGTLVAIAGAITWGVGANQMRFASLLP